MKAVDKLFKYGGGAAYTETELDDICGEIESLRAQLDFVLSDSEAKAARIRELEAKQLPNERGTNRYGLDVAYFRKTINRELNRDLRNFKPDELARVLARLSRTADQTVMHEPEFKLKAQSGEAVGEVMRFEEIIYAELSAPTIEMVGAKIYLAQPAAKVPECTWRCDDDESSMWEGSCGAAWYFESGGPVENEQNYCPSCGGKCVLSAQEGEK